MARSSGLGGIEGDDSGLRVDGLQVHSPIMAREVNSPRSAPAAPTGPGDTRLFLRDEELDRGIGLLLAGERVLASAVEETRLAAGLSRTELQALLLLRYHPGMDVKQLQTRLVTSVPTCARILASLDARGLILRDTPRDDRRRRAVSLSETGLALTQPIAAALRETLRGAYRQAGAERVLGARAVLEALVSDNE